jgi:heat shock protein HslJ
LSEEQMMRTSVFLSTPILVLALAACGTQPMAGSGDSSYDDSQEATTVQAIDQPLTELPNGTRWRLAESTRPSLQLPEATQVTIAFDDGRMHGDSGCNQYAAGYSLADGRIAMEPVAATKRGCPGARSEVERAWFEALQSLQWVSRDGDALLLRLAEGDAIRFVPYPLETR